MDHKNVSKQFFTVSHFKEGTEKQSPFYYYYHRVRSVKIPWILKNKTKPSVQENLFSP